MPCNAYSLHSLCKMMRESEGLESNADDVDDGEHDETAVDDLGSEDEGAEQQEQTADGAPEAELEPMEIAEGEDDDHGEEEDDMEALIPGSSGKRQSPSARPANAPWAACRPC